MCNRDGCPIAIQVFDGNTDEHDHAAGRSGADVDRGAGPTLTGGAAQGNHLADRRRLPLHSFRSLLRDLTTLMLNKTTVPANPNYTFNLLTKPTPLQPGSSSCSL